MTGLALPLSAQDNKPIRDAAGQIVSIPENAGAFAHAMNMHAKLVAALTALQFPIETFRGLLKEGSTARGNAERCLEQLQAILAEAHAGAKLPPAEEVGEQAVADILDDSTMTEAQALQFAKEIKAKFRVYSR